MNANDKTMRFSLFKQICFKVSDPIALIESYCFQSDFFSNFDLKPDKTVKDAAIIGARIPNEVIPEINEVIENTKKLKIFRNTIDSFFKLNNNTRDEQIKKFIDKAILSLIKIKYIGLSKSTKVYHTLYPQIIPMIDKLLKEKYKEINPQWTEEEPYQIFVAYYDNLKENKNLHNISLLQDELSEIGITCLTKVRIFDILWWSFLKAEKLKEKKNINWSTIRRVKPS